MGERTINVDNALVFDDFANNLKAVVIFNPIMKSGGIFSAHTYAGDSDEFRGLIYTPDLSITPSEKYKKWKDINDVKEPLANVEGCWLDKLMIGDKEYWNIDLVKPQRYIPMSAVLPSDWRFREDLIWLF